ncbi:hypothetical protein V3C99_008922 [Haemonchus contortus]|uniref:Transposable element n=1 Tax=Haemonchus contortus TaxID=6289 RepID=A0A7I4YJE6_HAECO
MARDMGISRKSMERVVPEDLKMCPYRTRKAAILSASNQQARVKKCRQLLLRTRNKCHHSIVFSDGKLFTVEQQSNAQNGRVIARNAEEADKKGIVVYLVARPVQVLVWAEMCTSGKTLLIFVDPGVKINKDYYLKTILEDALLPWTFQQDSAPSHKAKVV